MEHCGCFVFVVALVLLGIATEATSDGNDTTNVIQMFPPNLANATKEIISELSETRNINESDHMIPTKETINKLNKIRKSNESGNVTIIPLREDEPLKELNQSNIRVHPDGEFIIIPSEEECDLSNSCMDDKKLFIACLRVPGTDSLALSILIENNSTDALEINIVAPPFVNLEKTKVQLKVKEHKLVKVTLADGANDTIILLKSQESNCSLNLHNPLLMETPTTSFLFIRIVRRFTLVCFLLATASLLVLAYLFVKFRRGYPEAGFRYLKPDFELPVSTGGREIWDNQVDSWHDEEAPLTPSKPLSKPFSHGLNSRKISKEGWKTRSLLSFMFSFFRISENAG